MQHVSLWKMPKARQSPLCVPSFLVHPQLFRQLRPTASIRPEEGSTGVLSMLTHCLSLGDYASRWPIRLAMVSAVKATQHSNVFSTSLLSSSLLSRTLSLAISRQTSDVSMALLSSLNHPRPHSSRPEEYSTLEQPDGAAGGCDRSREH